MKFIAWFLGITVFVGSTLFLYAYVGPSLLNQHDPVYTILAWLTWIFTVIWTYIGVRTILHFAKIKESTNV